MSRLGELTAKVDGFFARVKARHGADMQCDTGCSDCCHVRLSITSVEAAAIREHVTGWSSEQRRTLGELATASSAAGDRCSALGPDGRCAIYPVRPLVCRSHGAPIKLARPGSLPVVEACFRNFTSTEPAADCVLDQTTLSALILAVDRDAGGDGARVELADLVAELAGI